MKIIEMKGYGDNGNLVYGTGLKPTPKHDELLIKVKATSINPLDWKVREGYLKEFFQPKLPFILGWDVAGEIVEVGRGISKFQVNDKVFGMVEIDSKRSGTYAEYVIVKEEEIYHMPKALTYEEASSIPLAGLTAWQALFEHGNLVKNQKVLIHAGAGGVGHFAIQFAKSIGAIVYTTASERNHEFLKGLGADHIIDYTKCDFSEVINEIDLVIDPIGGDKQVDSIKVLKNGGKIIALLGFNEEAVNHAKFKGVQTTHMMVHPSFNDLKSISKLVDERMIKPHLEKVYDFNDLHIALQTSMEGRVRGKLVIKI